MKQVLFAFLGLSVSLNAAEAGPGMVVTPTTVEAALNATPTAQAQIPVVNVKAYGKYNQDFMPASTSSFENAEVFTTVQAITEAETDSKEDSMACINLGVELLRKEARGQGADGLQNLRLTPLPVKKGVRFLSEADLVKFRPRGVTAVTPADIIKKEGRQPQVMRLNNLQSLRFGNRTYLFKDDALVSTIELPATGRKPARRVAKPDVDALMKQAERDLQHVEALRLLEEQARMDNQILGDLQEQTEGWIRFTNPPREWVTYPGGRILEEAR